MEREKTNVACANCGGTEYVKDVGYYFCLECQTQSQDLREEVFEQKYDAAGAPQLYVSLMKLPVVRDRDKSGDEEEWTTWEIYNFILRGQVEELLDLGVSQEFKYTVLQLWTHYLRKLELAFTSEKKPVLPKIGPSFREKDRNLVYGTPVSELRKKRKRRSFSSASTVSGVSSFGSDAMNRRLLRRRKRALIKLEASEHALNIETATDEAILSDKCDSGYGSASPVRRLRRTRYNKEAKRVLQVRRRRKKVCIPQKVLKRPRLLHYTNPKTLSRFRLLVLLYIALMYGGEKIQLSDLLRWIREGTLSYYEISHLLPEKYVIKGYDMVLFSPDIYLPSYEVFLQTARKMSKLLDVTYVIKPDVMEIASKLLTELQLPAMVSKLIERLLATVPVLMMLGKSEPPNYEGRVMAIIIVILKLLFGLDGSTEEYISSTATEINRLLAQDGSYSRLFVWSDWVRYIVCRKALVIEHHFPTKDNIASDLSTNLQVYMDCRKQLKEKHGISKLVSKHVIQPVLLDAMKRPFLKLSEFDARQHDEVYFPPSLTPYASYARKILPLIPKDEEGVREILSQDFTISDLNYLLEPYTFQKFAKSKGLEVRVKRKSALQQTKTVKVIDKPGGNLCCFRKKMVVIHIINRRINTKRKRFLGRSFQRISVGKRVTRTGERRSQRILDRSGKLEESTGEMNEGGQNKEDQVHRLNISRPGRRKNRFAVGSVRGSDCNGEKNDRLHVNILNKKRRDQFATRSRRRKSKRQCLTSVTKTQKLLHVPCCCSLDEALVMLRQYLSTNDRVQRTEESECSPESHVLYLPYPQYWVLQRSAAEKVAEEKFEHDIIKKLPVSFLWLLTECAQILQMSRKQLYHEVFTVEMTCADMFSTIVKDVSINLGL